MRNAETKSAFVLWLTLHRVSVCGFICFLECRFGQHNFDHKGNFHLKIETFTDEQKCSFFLSPDKLKRCWTSLAWCPFAFCVIRDPQSGLGLCNLFEPESCFKAIGSNEGLQELPIRLTNCPLVPPPIRLWVWIGIRRLTLKWEELRKSLQKHVQSDWWDLEHYGSGFWWGLDQLTAPATVN